MRSHSAILCVITSLGILGFVDPTVAAADDVTPMVIACDNRGETWYDTHNVVRPNKLTHYERYYNGTGSTMSASFSALHQATLTASVTVTSGGSVSASAVIAELKADTGLSLSASGSSTSSSSVGVSASLPNGKYLVAYRGNVQVTGSFTKYYCNTSGGLNTSATGTGKSFGVNETGAQRCDLAAPSGSMAALAKTTAC